jgi:hypothetical protein
VNCNYFIPNVICQQAYWFRFVCASQPAVHRSSWSADPWSDQ